MQFRIGEEESVKFRETWGSWQINNCVVYAAVKGDMVKVTTYRPSEDDIDRLCIFYTPIESPASALTVISVDVHKTEYADVCPKVYSQALMDDLKTRLEKLEYLRVQDVDQRLLASCIEINIKSISKLSDIIIRSRMDLDN